MKTVMIPEYHRLLAIDPSLSCSGWALFSLDSKALLAVGKVKSDPPTLSLPIRLVRLQERIAALFDRLNLGDKDVLVCEGPTSIKDPHNALKVEHVRSMFEVLGRGRAVSVPGRVNPRSVQFEVMGLHGKQIPRKEVKATAVQTAQFLFKHELERIGLISDSECSLQKHQDIIDAMLVGRYAMTKLQAARDGSFSLEEMFNQSGSQSRVSWRGFSGNVS